MAKRLAEIRVRFWNLPFGPHVEKPADADGGIAKEPVGFIAGAVPFSLEQIVDHPAGVNEVPAKIPNSGSDRFHDHEPISLAGRFDDASQKPLVETPHHPIEGFDGVGNRFGENNGFRLRLTSACNWFRRDQPARKVGCWRIREASSGLLPADELREAQPQDQPRRRAYSPAG